MDQLPCLFGGRAVNGVKQLRPERLNMPSVLTWTLLHQLVDVGPYAPFFFWHSIDKSTPKSISI